MKDKKVPLFPRGFDFEEIFDVHRYDECRNLDAGGWAPQLFFRRMMRFALSSEINDPNFNKAEVLSRLLLHPLGRNRSGPVLAKSGFLSVFDATVYDIWAKPGSMKMDPDLSSACNAADALWSQDNPDRAEEPDLCRRSYHNFIVSERPLHHDIKECLLCIDLTVTDEQLLGDFKLWLKAKRKTMKGARLIVAPSRNFTASDFAEWCEKRVLAYLDLQLLSDFAGRRISDRKIGDLLFPDELDVDIAERVRKVVRPCAELLTSDAIFSALDSQSARELSENRNRNAASFIPEQ